eukprot:2360232-Pleurochrysis_carterae.AAC.2
MLRTIGCCLPSGDEHGNRGGVDGACGTSGYTKGGQKKAEGPQVHKKPSEGGRVRDGAGLAPFVRARVEQAHPRSPRFAFFRNLVEMCCK